MLHNEGGGLMEAGSQIMERQEGRSSKELEKKLRLPLSAPQTSILPAYFYTIIQIFPLHIAIVQYAVVCGALNGELACT